MTAPKLFAQLASLAIVATVVGLVGGSTAAAGSAKESADTPQLQLPAPTGTQPIATATLYLRDRTRRDPLAPTRTRRRLVVQLWYPTATASGSHTAYMSPGIASPLEAAFELPHGTFSFATAASKAGPIARGRHPLLLLSHGLGTLREFSTALAGDLASRGYVVAAISHTYDAAAVEFANGRVIQGTAPVEPTERQRALLLRTRLADVRFVLDNLLKRARARTGLLARRIDRDKVGALGHSLGGATASAAMLSDSRIRAGVDLDGSVFGPVVAKGLGRPFMLLVGDHGGELTADQAQFFDRLRSKRYALTLRGAGHYSFTDLPLFAAALPGLNEAFEIGTIDPLRADRILRIYVAAFFAESLLHRPQTLLRAPSTAYPEVRFVGVNGKR